MYFEYTHLKYSMLSGLRPIGLVFYLISDYFNCRYYRLNPGIRQSQRYMQVQMHSVV